MPNFLHPIICFLLLITTCCTLSACHPERTESIRLMNKGLRAYKASQISAALSSLEKAAQVDPSNDQASYYQGIILNDLGRGEENPDRFEDAVRAFRKAIDSNSQSANTHYQLGVALKELGLEAKAIKSFRDAIALQNNYGEAYHRMGLLLQDQANYNDAQKAFHSAIISKPQLSIAYDALAQLYLRFKQPALAAQVLKNAIENHPDELEHYRSLGEIYEDQSQYARAVKLYEQALTQDPNHAPVLFLMARTHYKNKDLRAAEIYLKRYLNRSHTADEKLQLLSARKLLMSIRKKR
jgi:tetratricopeptide (TPR) repeat protein